MCNYFLRYFGLFLIWTREGIRQMNQNTIRDIPNISHSHAWCQGKGEENRPTLRKAAMKQLKEPKHTQNRARRD